MSKCVYYCAYRLNCKECGTKSADWTVDALTRGEAKKGITAHGLVDETFKKQYALFHSGHEYKAIKELRGGTKNEYEEFCRG